MTGVRDLALPLRDPADLDPLVERIGDAPEDTTPLQPLRLERADEHMPPSAHVL